MEAAVPSRWITLDRVEEAARRLAPVLPPTPLMPAPGLSRAAGLELLLKPENLQVTGSFKIRGAYNAVAAVGRKAGVVTASSGNHGQAVAFSARLLGMPAAVVVPQDASPVKVEAARRHGAEIIFHGLYPDERRERALAEARDRGCVYIDSTDSADVIAGQATIGSEILSEEPRLDAVVAPVGGGGIMSGVAAAVKMIRPRVKVFGAEPAGAASMHLSLSRGRPTMLPQADTMASGLRSRKPARLCFSHVQRYVDEVILVEEDDIAAALALLAAESRLVAEPSGAVALAAALSGRLKVPGVVRPRVAVIISGGNVSPGELAGLLSASPAKAAPAAGTAAAPGG